MCIIMLIITYSYWSLILNNSELNEQLQLSESKLSDLNQKKSHLEDQNNRNLADLQMVKSKLADLTLVMKQKENEASDFHSKIDDKNKEIEQQKNQNNELRDAYLVH